jgi:hypothetical protein
MIHLNVLTKVTPYFLFIGTLDPECAIRGRSISNGRLQGNWKMNIIKTLIFLHNPTHEVSHEIVLSYFAVIGQKKYWASMNLPL